MSMKTKGWLIAGLGLLLLALSLAADAVGVGARAGFGWKQLAGTLAGLALTGWGIWLAFRKPAENP
jgi:hypothetical protein